MTKAEREVLCEHVEAMWYALSFYADPETYIAIGFMPDPPCGEFIKDFSFVKDDPVRAGAVRPGKRARRVLNKIQAAYAKRLTPPPNRE